MLRTVKNCAKYTRLSLDVRWQPVADEWDNRYVRNSHYNGETWEHSSGDKSAIDKDKHDALLMLQKKLAARKKKTTKKKRKEAAELYTADGGSWSSWSASSSSSSSTDSGPDAQVEEDRVAVVLHGDEDTGDETAPAAKSDGSADELHGAESAGQRVRWGRTGWGGLLTTIDFQLFGFRYYS